VYCVTYESASQKEETCDRVQNKYNGPLECVKKDGSQPNESEDKTAATAEGTIINQRRVMALRAVSVDQNCRQGNENSREDEL